MAYYYTPGYDPSTGYSAAFAQSAAYAAQGASYGRPEAAAYTAYEQPAQAASSVLAATRVAPAREPLAGDPAAAAAQAAPSNPAAGAALAAEGAKGVTELLTVVRLQHALIPSAVAFMSGLSFLLQGDAVLEGTVGELPDTTGPVASSLPFNLIPQQGNLLVGALPIDLANLRRAVDDFFVRLENLAAEGWTLPATKLLVPWTTAALLATGAFVFARRRPGSSQLHTPFRDGDAATWDPSSVLALLPPEDTP
jgi:hypothetical protein